MTEPTIDRARLEVGFRVGDYLVEPQLQRISKATTEIRVEPKVMETLVCMAERPRQTVTKQQFSETVWSGTIVTDDAILRCISELRKIFEDDHTEPRYIETIRKKGYRLIAPISMASQTPPPAPVASSPTAEAPAPVEAPLEPQPVSPGRSLWIGGAIFLIVVLGGVIALRSITDQHAPVPLKMVPLTSYPGQENDPNLSPDGSRVAFVWDQGDGGSFDIYIKQIGVETPLRLTRDAADDSSPAWSPDGQQLAFIRAENGTYSLYLVPTAGGSARKVFDLGERAVRNVAWSPDGTTLAFSAEQTPLAPFALSLLSLDTVTERRLTQPPDDYEGDLEVAFSPDGRMIAFSRSAVEKVEDIYVVPIAGGEIKRLTFDRAQITGLDWTTNGKHIVYSSDREGSPALWRIPASGGAAPSWVPTTSEGSGLHQPSVARQGDRLAFVQRLQETNIWEHALRPVDATQTPRQHTASTRWDSNPALSPDGRRVAFASNRSGTYEIWTCDRDGANPVLLTHLNGPSTHTPRWSPDGRHIAFVTRNEGGTDIFVVSALGGPPLPLTTAASNDQAPGWSRDGQWVYFASNRSGRWETWKIPAEGGAAVQVTQGGGFGALEAPGGQTLYFVKRDAPGIWQMPTDGGPERLVVSDLQPFDWGNWDVREGGLYFLRRDAGGPVLAFYRFATDTVEPLLPLERIPKHPAIAIAHDETHLLFTRIDRIDADILLVEDYQ